MACTWFLFPCVLLLHIVGAGFAYQVENGIFEGSIYFYESVPIQDNPVILWTFKNAIIAQLLPGAPPVCVGQYAGRCALYENGTLTLNSLTFADEGIYTITAQYLNTTPILQSTYGLRIYTVLSSPALGSNGTSNSLISGTYVSLYCDAGSLNVTAYTFYRDGKNICSDLHVTCQDSYLYFQPITGSDSGNYTCTIQNPVSSSTSNTLWLNVSVPVSDVKLASNATGLVWPGFSIVSLTCSARGTDVTYSWSLQGEPLPQNPQYYLSANNTVLTISNVTANDNGTFTCTASNWINNETSIGVIFNLASLISAVTLTSNTLGSYIWVGEDSVSLHCSADGSDVAFHWNLNGEPLPQDSRYQISEGDSPPHSNLLISPVSRSDSGPFICEASNLYSIKNSSGLNLNLAWNPEGPISCNAVNLSGNIELGCSWPGGHPAANVSLIFNGVSDNGLDSVTRVVSTSGNFKGSNLICFGGQLGRTSQCSLIFELPQSSRHNNSRIISVIDGQAAVMTLDLVPGLHSVFTWYRFNQELATIQNTGNFTVISNSLASSLLITSVTEENVGKYECKAENIVGSQSFLFTLNVTAPIQCPISHGLGGGKVAGIVIGVVAGITIIEVIVFFILKTTKKTSPCTKNENSNIPLPPTSMYSTIMPGNEQYTQNRGIYSNLELSMGNR